MSKASPQKLLENKIAIVTGAASGVLYHHVKTDEVPPNRYLWPGFGLAIAELFNAHGAKVVLADINSAGEGIAKRLSASGPTALFVHSNVTCKADWESLVRTAREKLGGLDILVNNAGWTYTRKDTLLVTEQEYDRLFDVNVKAIYHSINAVLPHFIAQGGGSIVNISSCITAKATSGLTWYGATKGAVDMITRHIATEYSSKGIRSNAVAPSISETPLMREFLGEEPNQDTLSEAAAHVPVGRLCTPMDIAKATLYFASPYFNDFQTGMILRTDGGNYA